VDINPQPDFATCATALALGLETPLICKKVYIHIYQVVCLNVWIRRTVRSGHG
jgi:hypothetical protein